MIFSDVSRPLLERCQRAVAARGLLDRARFVSTRAEDLAEIPDASVDIATTRSVLIYVTDNAAAVADLAGKVKMAFAALDDDRATISMIDFDDRDLARLAEAAGFDRIHVECHIAVDPDSPMRAMSIDALLDSAPNPLAPTLRESVTAALSRPELEPGLARASRSAR